MNPEDKTHELNTVSLCMKVYQERMNYEENVVNEEVNEEMNERRISFYTPLGPGCGLDRDLRKWIQWRRTPPYLLFSTTI